MTKLFILLPKIAMNVVIIILVLFIPFLILYKMYEPRIDVAIQPTEKAVLLWYNLYVEGYPTGKRTFKKLFTLGIPNKKI